MKSKVTLKIPRELYEKLKEIIEGTGFSSVNSFIVYTMRTIASGGKLKEKEESMTQEEINKVRERLRSLGYID